VLTALSALALPATSASARPTGVAAGPAVGAAARAAAPSVADLSLTGATATVTVRRIYRKGQLRWVSHVLDIRLVDLSGCQAVRGPVSWSQHVYRSTVHALCLAGTGPVQTAADRLTQSRPWYRITVTPVPMVGFTLLADLPTGKDTAVPAALAALPSGDQVFAEGDDVSLNYAGPSVTQAQLDAAVTAFAGALGVRPDQVKVSRLGS
jgi:hypothetical protein